MSRCKIAFSTLACPDWSWQEILHHGPEYGYNGVEIRLIQRELNLLNRPEFQPDQLAIRRRELLRANFHVCGLASSVHLDVPEAREAQVRLGGEYLALTESLGGEFLRVFGDVLPDDPPLRRQTFYGIADGLKALGDLAGPRGIMVLLETHGDFSASLPVVELMRIVDHPHVGVLWDTHHPWRFHGEAISETWAALKQWTRHTHWKDSVLLPDTEQRPLSPSASAAASLANSHMRGHQHADYVLFGGGEFPARECLRVMTRDGYNDWFALEWEKMWHPDLVGPEVALPLFPRKLRDLLDSLPVRSSM